VLNYKAHKIVNRCGRNVLPTMHQVMGRSEKYVFNFFGHVP